MSLYHSFNVSVPLKTVKKYWEKTWSLASEISCHLLSYCFFLFLLFVFIQIPVSSLRDTVLELAVFDQHRRKFDNFSSLILEWKSLNETLAHFENYNSVEMVAKDDGSGQTRLHGIVNIYKSFYIPTKWLCTKYFPVRERLFILSHLSSSIFIFFRKHKGKFPCLES